MTQSDELVVLGAITKPHGLSGGVHVVSFNADPHLLLSLKQIHVRAPGTTKSVVKQIIESHCPRQRKLSSANAMLLMRLSDIPSIEVAETFRGYELCVPRSELPELSEDDFYLIDLIGLMAMQKGEALGKVLRVLEYPTTDCAEIACEGGTRELPLVEPWLVSVDVSGGVIEVGAWDDLPLQVKKKKKPKKPRGGPSKPKGTP